MQTNDSKTKILSKKITNQGENVCSVKEEERQMIELARFLYTIYQKEKRVKVEI
jgi:hypothetical protein